MQSSLHRDPSCHRDLSKLALRLIMSSFVSSVADSSSNWAVCGKSSGLVSMPVATGSSQKMQIEVMPLFAGHLPYPWIKVLKYLPHTSGVFNQPDPGMLHCGFCTFQQEMKQEIEAESSVECPQTAAWRTTVCPCWMTRWTRQASAAGAACTLWAAATISRRG